MRVAERPGLNPLSACSPLYSRQWLRQGAKCRAVSNLHSKLHYQWPSHREYRSLLLPGGLPRRSLRGISKLKDLLWPAAVVGVHQLKRC